MTGLRSFIDRVLRLKEEQDALTSDIREVYAEAKSSGFDKTAMGHLVAHLRKREKDPVKLQELSTFFELYLHEYDNGTEVANIDHAHTHEANATEIVNEPLAAHEAETADPVTGELPDIPAHLDRRARAAA